MVEPTPGGAPAPDPGSARSGAARPGYPPAPPPYPAGEPYPPAPAGYPPGPPGYPSYAAPQRPQQPGTDGFAVASLVFGIIGGILLSVVFGIVALTRIKRTGKGGRGLAIAGLTLSGLWTVLVIGLIVTAVATSADRAPGGEVIGAGDVSASSLEIGDCLADPPSSMTPTEVSSLAAVPCSQPHRGEVFAVFDLPSGPYPGQTETDRLTEAGCNDRLGAYSPSSVSDDAVQLSIVYPLERGWTLGDRSTTCIARTEQPGTGSIRGR